MALQPTLKKVATKLIAKFGRDVTHVTVTAGKYSPSLGDSTTKTEQTIKAFISNYTARDYTDNVKVGDAPMITTTEVKMNDEIISNGSTYRVTQSEAIPLEDGIVMYSCNLRSL